MTEIPGKLAIVETAPQNDTMDALKARIAASEAAPQPQSLVPAESPAPATAPNQEEPTPSAAPAQEPKSAPKDGVPQELKDKNGEVDPGKAQEATERLQKRTQEKAAALAKFKEAQREFTQVSQELSRAERDKPTTSQPSQPQQPMSISEETVTPEFRQRFAEDLAKDDIGTLVKLMRAVVRQEQEPLRASVYSSQEAKREAERLEGLEKLAKQGHDWVWTPDGIDKLNVVLNQRPWLRNDPDPYGAAFRFLDDVPSASVPHRGSAPATGLTPTLGANSAVPPVSSAPAPSNEQVLAQLSKEQKQWLERGETKKAQAIQEQMDKIVRGY